MFKQVGFVLQGGDGVLELGRPLFVLDCLPPASYGLCCGTVLVLRGLHLRRAWPHVPAT
jgi:hypothetical protein